MKVPLVHDLEQHVRRVRAEGQVPHLVDDEDARVRVGDQRLP